MIGIKISPAIIERWSDVKLGCISCDVLFELRNDALWKKIQHISNDINATFEMEEIALLPAIYSSRKAYRAIGKDPARYRLSAESLLRRIVKGDELYQINNIVDALNLLSVETGFSIGGYDFDLVQGDIILDIGKNGEPYAGVGRGQLNIEGLPVLYDTLGPFGCPTSDSERTSVTSKTKRFLMVIFAFGSHEKLADTMQKGVDLLSEFASADSITTLECGKHTNQTNIEL